MTNNASGSTKADRVRENQRRCRARKREYITSMEERLRRCQEEGVKANVELQEAAQRVVDENRELRALLHQLGLSDYDIQVKLSVMRATAGAQAPPNSNRRELVIAPQSAEARLAGINRTSNSALPLVRDITSDINSPTAPSPPIPETTGLSSISEMEIFCSLFTPSCTTFSSYHPGTTCCSSTSFEASSSANIIEVRSSSTPCSVAYSLLTRLNSRRHEQQNIVVILLDLLDGFRAAPEGDPDGCRVDNTVLILVMDKLLVE